MREFIADQPRIAGILLGVQVAVIARSVQRIRQHIVTGPPLAAISLIALVATPRGVPFWVALMAGACAYSRAAP